MAPTTLEGQRTTTTQAGRDFARAGKPIRVCEMLATIEGATFVERVSLDTPANIRKAKMATKKAFENQIAGKGFSIVAYKLHDKLGNISNRIASMDKRLFDSSLSYGKF